MSVQNESCPNCGWQFDVLVAQEPCRSCTGLGDMWRPGPLPAVVHGALLLVEFGYPDEGPFDRDRFLFATGARDKWRETAGLFSSGDLQDSTTFNVVRWQWLRGEPGTQSQPVEHELDNGDCPF